jgi:hypothetical protein
VQEVQPPVQSALPSFGVERVLDAAKPGDTVSFIMMPAGTRREVTYLSRTNDGFTGRKSSGKVQNYSVKACREMYIPAGEPSLRARQISLGSEGSETT